MTNYDEYQKFIRYKYGHHSFLLVLILVFINSWLSLFRDIQWAETKELETMLLIFIAVIYSIVMNTYHGAYFNRKQSPKIYAFIFFILGIVNIYLALSPYTPLIVDRKVTLHSLTGVSAILWLSIPAAYLMRRFVDIKREKED